MKTDTQQSVAALLAEAGAAHGAYEEHELNGVYDQNWPAWYSTYLLQHNLSGLLGAPLAADQLSQLLRQYDQDYQRERPVVDWPQFYAARLIREAR